MENRYNKEYEQYYIYALEQFLIKTSGFSEHDAKVKVMQDFDEIKKDFETEKIITIINSIVILILLLLLSGGSCPTKTSKKQSDGYSKKSSGYNY